MTFNFEVWSENVFRVTAYMDGPAAAETNTEAHRAEMKQLWEQLNLEEEDKDVLFLKMVLNEMKDLVVGKLNRENFEKTLQGLRDILIQEGPKE
jgi:hypothetical protein